MRRGLGSLPTANGGIARAAYNVAITRGLDVQPLLKRSNLTTAQIKKPHVRIAARAQIAFLNEVASAIQDDFLGVHLAQSLDLRELGLLYYVLASSETLGEALKRLARYSGIHNEGVHITCQNRNTLGVDFQYLGVSRVSDFHQIEFFVTVLVRLCRELSGRRILPIAVQFIHRKSAVPSEIKTFFGCGLEFGAREDRVVFASQATRAMTVNPDPYLNSLMRQYCEEVLCQRRIKVGDWRSNVENAVAPLLPHGEATIENVAQRLGVSTRTLARRLATENVTFVEVLSELRLELAKRHLQEPRRKIAEVAWLLGYEDPSAFSHAFKRWTGASPRQLASAAPHSIAEHHGEITSLSGGFSRGGD
jgi:AraC-like DNA-binding protein